MRTFRTRPIRLPSRTVAATVCAVLLAGPVVGWGVWRRAIAVDRDARFAAEVVEGRDRVGDELGRYADLIDATTGLFAGSDGVTAAEFDRFLTALSPAARHPALRSVGYFRRVPRAGLRDFAAEMTRQGRPVRLPAAPGAEEHYLLAYEATTGAPRGFRLDVTTVPSARDAMRRAADTGGIVLADRLPLSGGGAGFAMFGPVYAPGPADTAAARRAAVVGWVGVLVDGEHFLSGAFAGARPDAAYELFGAGRETAPLSTSAPVDPHPEFERTVEVSAFGATWPLRVTAGAGAYESSRIRLADLLLAAGLSVALALGGVLWLLALAETRARRRADEAAATLRESEARFRTLVACAPVGIFQFDAVGGPVYVNPRLREILGIDADLVAPDRRLVHPDDVGALAAAWDASAHRDDGATVRFRVVRPDGAERWLSTRIAAMRDDEGNVLGRIGSVDDVQAAVEAQQRTDRLTAIVEATTDLVLVYDEEGRIAYANDAALRFHGLDPAADLGDCLGWYPPRARSLLLDETFPALRRHGIWSGETTMLDGAGNEVPVSQVVVAHVPADGGPTYYSSISRDLSERYSYERRLVHEKLHDPLTGLANRALFLDRVQQALARAETADHTVAVAFLDLDRFKLLNDSLGHDAGDELLVAVGRRLTEVLGSTDTAARFNADEFVLLDEEVRSEREFMALADRIGEAFAAPIEVAGRQLRASACIGLAVATAEHRRPEDLLRDANAALTKAKEKGTAQIEVFDQQLRLRAVRRLELGSALHRALERGELRVHYQPEINLVDGSVSGLEALVRWQHPTEGLLGPTEFIPLAEENGLIDRVGEFVFAEACWQSVRWNGHRRSAGLAPVTVWVNLSARQIGRSDVVERISAILAESGADPASIGLEITESTLFDDVEVAVETLTRLRALGVRLGVDDFGTGWSSLTYLKRLPVEMVKIDRSFVEGVGTDPESTAIVAAVVSMARALGLVVVAEGAENAEQVAALRTLGCGMAQGYYFASPQPRQVVDALLRQAPPPWAADVTVPLKAPAAASTAGAAVPRPRDAAEREREPGADTAIIL